MMSQIAIEIEKAEGPAARAEAEAAGIALDLFETKRFEGGVAIVAAVTPFVLAALPTISKIIQAQIAARRHVKVKIDGVEIQGLNAADTKSVLTQILASRAGGGASDI